MSRKVDQRAEELCRAERCCSLDQLHASMQRQSGREKADAAVEEFRRRARAELGEPGSQDELTSVSKVATLDTKEVPMGEHLKASAEFVVSARPMLVFGGYVLTVLAGVLALAVMV